MNGSAGQAPTDVAIVGGGLAGLSAAAHLARAGRSVALFERSEEPGGRARTQDHDGFLFNFGPHALYRGGAGAPILRDLGVAWRGRTPGTAGYAIAGGARHLFPAGPRSILATTLLARGAKLELLTLLPRLLTLDTAPLDGATLEAWLDREVRHEENRRLIALLVRVTTYAADPARLSAGAALAQLRLGLTRNVDYIDGGWATLVAGLRRAAEGAGARIVTGARVVGIERDPLTGAARGVRLAGGAVRAAGAVIIAAEPQTVGALVGDADPALAAWMARAIPLQMACLDVGLRALPEPAKTLAFGLDRPLYLSVHSAVADLAPAGGAVIHVGKNFCADRAADPDDDRRELEGLLDLVKPGWRDLLVTSRFLPRMTVANALPTAAGGGLAGRPGPAVAGIPGLYIAGDWVGGTGMLADAALASAREAARLVLAAPPAARAPQLATAGA